MKQIALGILMALALGQALYFFLASDAPESPPNADEAVANHREEAVEPAAQAAPKPHAVQEVAPAPTPQPVPSVSTTPSAETLQPHTTEPVAEEDDGANLPVPDEQAIRRINDFMGRLERLGVMGLKPPVFPSTETAPPPPDAVETAR